LIIDLLPVGIDAGLGRQAPQSRALLGEDMATRCQALLHPVLKLVDPLLDPAHQVSSIGDG
jgi:hypothetical protein